MREPVQTDDDLAVMAAKENLASLPDRAGYHEAMRPAMRRASRVAQLTSLVLALGLGGLVYAAWVELETPWLRIAITVVLGLLALLALFAAVGFAAGMPPQRWGVAVVGKRIDESDRKLVTLLREDGATRELRVVDTIHAMLRAGDCGVAEVSVDPRLGPVIVVGFYRL